MRGRGAYIEDRAVDGHGGLGIDGAQEGDVCRVHARPAAAPEADSGKAAVRAQRKHPLHEAVAQAQAGEAGPRGRAVILRKGDRLANVARDQPVAGERRIRKWLLRRARAGHGQQRDQPKKHRSKSCGMFAAALDNGNLGACVISSWRLQRFLARFHFEAAQTHTLPRANVSSISLPRS